jgi:hypothetical protein
MGLAFEVSHVAGDASHSSAKAVRRYPTGGPPRSSLSPVLSHAISRPFSGWVCQPAVGLIDTTLLAQLVSVAILAVTASAALSSVSAPT